jgi:hypothetical protein
VQAAAADATTAVLGGLAMMNTRQQIDGTAQLRKLRRQ